MIPNQSLFLFLHPYHRPTSVFEHSCSHSSETSIETTNGFCLLENLMAESDSTSLGCLEAHPKNVFIASYIFHHKPSPNPYRQKLRQ